MPPGPAILRGLGEGVWRVGRGEDPLAVQPVEGAALAERSPRSFGSPPASRSNLVLALPRSEGPWFSDVKDRALSQRVTDCSPEPEIEVGTQPEQVRGELDTLAEIPVPRRL